MAPSGNMDRFATQSEAAAKLLLYVVSVAPGGTSPVPVPLGGGGAGAGLGGGADPVPVGKREFPGIVRLADELLPPQLVATTDVAMIPHRTRTLQLDNAPLLGFWPRPSRVILCGTRT